MSSCGDREKVEARILEVCNRLGPYLSRRRTYREAIDTADVDGEFYWRVARTDFVDRIAALRSTPLIQDRQDLLAINSVVDDLWVDYWIPQPAGWAHLLHDKPLHVREARVYTVSAATELTDERLVVEVPSAAWTGKHVAEAVRRRASYDERFGARGLTPPSRRTDATELHITFTPLLEEKPASSNEGPPLRQRYEAIKVEVWLLPDLPPPELVGQAYDAIVRDLRQWHRHMIDALAASDRQTPEVAARTWVVGLLCHAGYTVARALAFAEIDAGLSSTTEGGFRRERAKLVARVPEAADLLGP